MVKLCGICGECKAALKRPKTGEQLCKGCFFSALEEEVHQTIVTHRLFSPGERVAVAASGGKDSTVLAHMLTTLNARHGYGLDLFLLSIDEGIAGYRDDSLETVKRNEAQYGIPLTVLSYAELYGWTMDAIVRAIGHRSNCTFCGVFRRQALDRGAALMRADKVATGHNADDIAETVLLNLLRGDVPRLGRCANIVTGEDGALPRCKPLKYTYEKEIVMYAHFKRLDYFSTECTYSPFAARGAAREFVKDLEAVRPRAILDLITSAEQLRLGAREGGKAAPVAGTCQRCGYISSQAVCKACLLLEGLNRGAPRQGVQRTGPGRGHGQPGAGQPADGEDGRADGHRAGHLNGVQLGGGKGGQPEGRRAGQPSSNGGLPAGGSGAGQPGGSGATQPGASEAVRLGPCSEGGQPNGHVAREPCGGEAGQPGGVPAAVHTPG